MQTEDLDYELPPDRIAIVPARQRDAARLMVIHRRSGRIEHRRIRDLLQSGLFQAGDLLVVNRSKVLPACFQAKRVATGGRVGGLFLSSSGSQQWIAMLEAGGTLQKGEAIELEDRTGLTLVEPLGAGQWRLRCDGRRDPIAVLRRVGQTPIPPYIRQARRRIQQPEVRPQDVARYNTVYATDLGSAAAPTAGLHFTRHLLNNLSRIGVKRADVTLHIGLGTFEPIRTERLDDHRMHREWFHVPQETLEAIHRTRDAGRRIVPVGTTTVRALESLPRHLREAKQGFTADTDLFIQPDCGFVFHFTDALLTNFHLPRSTLLALVAALPDVGIQKLKRWYAMAIDEGYRFYSYGDAMLIL